MLVFLTFSAALLLMATIYLAPPVQAAGAPVVTTGDASGVSSASANLAGVVNPEGFSTTYQVEYGTTTSYGSKVPTSPKSIGSGVEPVAVSEKIEGLSPHSTYHFRVTATNNKGTTYGSDETFTTSPAYSSQFGTKGTGNGQFNSPFGIAVEPSGNFWVADLYNNRVQKFNSNGEYLSQFGSSGSGNGQFQSPAHIAISPAGDLWVTDVGNYRVQKFNSKGEYLAQFGSVGWGNGQFVEAWGVAVAPNGNVWVSDRGSSRVQEFTPSGVFVRSISGGWPAGIAADAQGNIWVASDGVENAVRKIDPKQGKYVFQFGSWGDGKTQFQGLHDIAILPSGNIITAERHNGRVKEFTPAGQYVTELAGAPSVLEEPNGLAAGGGAIYVANSPYHNVQKWCAPLSPAVVTQAASSVKGAEATINASVNPRCAATTYQVEYGTTTSYGSKVPTSPKSIGSGVEPVAVSEKIEGLSPHSTYHFRVTATNNKGTTYGSDETFTTSPAYSSQFGTKGTGNGQFNSPFGIAVEPSGNFWVADLYNNRVQKFNSNGEYLSQFGSSGSGNGQFQSPAHIAISPAGDLWVTDVGNYRVQKFNSKGEYLAQFGSVGWGNGQFVEAWGVAVAPNGNVWVSDRGSSRVQEFTPSGVFVRSISGGWPAGIAADAQGNIWVASDGVENAVRKIDPKQGKYVFQFGSWGDGKTQFQGLHDIAILPSGNIITAERHNGRVKEFTPAGQYVTELAGAPSVLEEPNGLAAGGGAIYVANSPYHNVQKWCAPLSPAVVTQAASSVKGAEATINASVNPRCAATTYQVEYGTTTSYGSKVPTSPKSIGSGTAEVAVAQTLEGLSPATTYHYRVVATNGEGITKGEDKTFGTVAAPVLTSTNPPSPANNNSPKVFGSAVAGSTIRLYTNPTCAGAPAATGTAALFASSGITVSVVGDATTSFYATATSPAGSASACSVSTVSYVEDSTAPSSPAFTTTNPKSPANYVSPRIVGSASAGTTVKLFANATCSGAPIASGSSAAFNSPGIAVEVSVSSTTTYRATATDPAGNTSACSSAQITYVAESAGLVLDAGFEDPKAAGLYYWNISGVGDVAPTVTEGDSRTGKKKAKFKLTGSQKRSELILGGTGTGSSEGTELFEESDESYYAFSFKILSMTYGHPGTHNLIMQLKSNDLGSPNFGLQLWDYEGDAPGEGGKGLWTSGAGAMGAKDEFLSEVSEQQWHDVVIHFVASSTNKGSYEVYLDGSLIDSGSNVSVIVPGATHAYIKNGLYRNGETNPGTSEILIDNAKLGTTLASVGGLGHP